MTATNKDWITVNRNRNASPKVKNRLLPNPRKRDGRPLMKMMALKYRRQKRGGENNRNRCRKNGC
mgnify:CR=1 FL=1